MRKMFNMVRLNHYLPKPQVQVLRILMKETGLSMAELVRRAVEEYLKRQSLLK